MRISRTTFHLKLNQPDRIILFSFFVSFFLFGRFSNAIANSFDGLMNLIALVVEGQYRPDIFFVENCVPYIAICLSIYILYEFTRRKETHLKSYVLIMSAILFTIVGYASSLDFWKMHYLDVAIISCAMCLGMSIVVILKKTPITVRIVLLLTIINIAISLTSYINVYNRYARQKNDIQFYNPNILNAIGRIACPAINDRAQKLTGEDAVVFYAEYMVDNSPLGYKPSRERVREYFHELDSKSEQRPYLPLYSCGNVVNHYLATQKTNTIAFFSLITFVALECIALFSLLIGKLLFRFLHPQQTL